MIYKISYKSRDLRRKNVLVYGIEELPLFEVNINISGYACETEERVRQIEEYSNDFIVRWIMPNWGKIVEMIMNNKEVK